MEDTITFVSEEEFEAKRAEMDLRVTSREERNAYVVACLRRGVRPKNFVPEGGFIIPETPKMYRG